MTESEALQAHQPVMLEEVLEGLNLQPAGCYLEATFGRGGHAQAILSHLEDKGRLLVMDKDPEAIQIAKAFAAQDARIKVCQGSFIKITSFCQEMGMMGKINGILLDLGVSSPQLDTAERGFSFRLPGPLDMRMDPTTGVSAAEWLNTAEESEIAWVLKTYGEERFHKRIAHAIIQSRVEAPLVSTDQLALVIANANPAWEKHKHPATRSFQAIRMFINNELDELSQCLEQSLDLLAPKGRLVVMSFHSLEDRVVKRFIQKHERDEHPHRLPVLQEDTKPMLRRVGQKKRPTQTEIAKNPRARSAVLRVAEKRGKR